MANRDDDRKLIRAKNRVINYPFEITEEFMRDYEDDSPEVDDTIGKNRIEASINDEQGGSVATES